MESLVITYEEKCIGYNNCIRACPVFGANKALRNENGDSKGTTIPSNCICCGYCVERCAHNARDYVGNTEKIAKALLIASVNPTIYSKAVPHIALRAICLQISFLRHSSPTGGGDKKYKKESTKKPQPK